MKKILIIFILLSLNLFAKEVCYSVELFSVVKTSKFPKIDIPDGCKKLEIGNYFSIRCGCSDSVKGVKDELHKFKAKFPKAYITTTYKYRFQTKEPMKKEETQYIVKKSEKIIKVEKIKKVKEFVIYGYDFLDLKKQQDFLDDKTIIKTMKKLYKDKDIQLKFLSDSSKFYGLSLDAKYDQYFNQNYRGREYTDFEYNVKLKYDFLKNGYFGHQKKLKNEKNIIRTTFYNDMINLERYSYKQMIQRIDSLFSLINFNYYTSYYNLTQEMILKKSNLSNVGVVPIYETKLLEQDLYRYKKLVKMYDKMTEKPLDSNLYSLLRKIQDVKLIDKDIMKKYAKEHNSDVLLQTSKLELLESTKNYLDESIINMYASNRTMDEIGRYNTVGVEAIFPLNLSSFEDKELKKLQKSSIISYKNALYSYLDSSIDSLYDEFYQTRYLIENTRLKFDTLDEKLKKYKLIEQNNIVSLNTNIVDKIYQLKQRMLELKLEISKSKLLLLKTLVKLAYLTNKLDINFIVQKR